MMTSPSSLARAPWVLYGVAGAVCTLLFLVAPQPRLQAIPQAAIYLSSAGLLIRTWWRARATRRDPLFTLAAVAFTVYFGASVLGIVIPLTSSPTSTPSVPSPLDVLFLLSYLLLAGFLWRLGSRTNSVGRSDLLDTLIVLGGLAPVFSLVLIEPLLRDGDLSPALVTFVAYPVIVFFLLAMTVRLAFLAPRRTTPHLLLAGWITLELVADVVFLRSGISGTYVYGQPWQAMWIVSATCIGALALHPSTDQLLVRRSSRPVNGPRRLLLLAACLVLPIGTIGFTEFLHERTVGLLVPIVMLFVLVILICLRLSGLMVDNAAQLRARQRMQTLTDDLAYQTLHDPLTGLGNRLLFAERADHALAQRPIAGDRATAVLLLDLDDFKTVNDSYGHDAGDRVLVEVSRRLERVTRSGERIFRLGGDEFAFVLAHAQLADVLRLADRIALALAEPFDIGPRTVRPIASMGISIALNGQDRSTLLAEADMAMYEGKGRASSAPSVFDPVLHTAALDRNQLERDLRLAVGRGELRLLYQPIVQLATNDIVGVEALVRWEHPIRGTVSPLQFIPIAEANESILDIGDWVLEESLRQLQVWDATSLGRRLRMSVNVSPRQLADPEFVHRAAGIVRASGLEPARVNLEITEASFGSDAEKMIERLHELKGLGVTLAIDDFGTDYSSLSHLRRLPVDILKIDKSFVDGIATEPAEWALTTAIIQLADSLGKVTVAEGIETGGQLAHLRSLNVEFGQGYLFAKPLNAADISGLLDAVPGGVFAFG